MSYTVKDVNLTDVTFDTETVGTGSNLAAAHVSKAAKSGCSVAYNSLDVGVTAEVLSTMATNVNGGSAFNEHASALRYLKIYDKATQATENDTPKMVIPLKAQEQTPIIFSDIGVSFVNGISIRATTGRAHSDTGAPTSGDVSVNLLCSTLAPMVLPSVGTAPAAGLAAVVTG